MHGGFGDFLCFSKILLEVKYLTSNKLKYILQRNSENVKITFQSLFSVNDE
jgi:hypothetical protein